MGKEIKNKKHWALLALLGVVCAGVALINLIYYDQLYPLFVGAHKTYASGTHASGIKIVALSRSLTQLLLPVQFAPEYSIYSPLGYLGLPLFALLCWLLALKLRPLIVLFLVAFALHPLILINLKATNIFVSDTYLLMPLLGLGLFIAAFRPPLLPVIVLTLFAGSKTLYESTLTTKQSSYYRTGHEREPNCRNALAYANYLLRETKLPEFYETAGSALSNNCLFGGNSSVALMGHIYGFRIFMDQGLADKEKLGLLEKVEVTSPSVVYLKIILLARLGEAHEAKSEFKRLSLEKLPLKNVLKQLHQQNCPSGNLCEEIGL
jgi:hypothetical protein